jgi:hypothetical protein
MYRVRIVGTGWSGGPSLNTLYFTSGSYTAAGALDVVTHVRAAWESQLSHLVAGFVTQNISGDVDVIDPATGDITNTLTVAPPAGLPGSGSAGGAPIVAAAVLRITTGLFLSGRRLRGRAFISPLAANAIEADGTMTSTALAQGNGFYGVLTAALTAGDAWVVWHRPVGGAGGVAGEVATATLNDKIGELRSRRD